MRAAKIPPDVLAVQRDASDPAVSAWVAANAGSGKTHVLAQRVIRLLLNGTAPEKILCLTYTKAAAANMANRVFETLGQWTALDDAAVDAHLRPQGSRTVLGAVRALVPDRLATMLLERAEVEPSRSLAELPRDERRRLLDALLRGELPWTGDEGYRKAEVTGGGVSLAEIDPRTMESRRHPGLFLCGEVLDAFGPIGGYNFLWAWATGRAAGQGAARPRPAA